MSCTFFTSLNCLVFSQTQQLQVLKDSVVVAANPSLTAGHTKKIFLGKNYRKEWTTPVKVPVLKMATAFGGLSPVKEGGGKQTHSLLVKNSDGRAWSLRSVKKFPEGAVPPALKNTIAEIIVNDAISASYPYGGLSANILAKAAGVPYFKDSLVFIPDDPALGEYRQKYKNLLVLMEEKTPTSFLPGIGSKKITLISTGELIDELANKQSRVNQEAVLQARLLDNFMMDFDRHEEQWKWMTVDTGNYKMYFPVPSDRDQVFFINNGIVPHFAKSKNALPELAGFHKKADNIETFNKPARNFDRFFLTQLSEDQWSRQVDIFLNVMTDVVIEDALHQQPKEIQPFAAERIIKTLKEKRLFFKADMMKYYAFLAHTVSIVGTNGPERVSATTNQEGNVLVSVANPENSDDKKDIIYSRLFIAAKTKEIRIYGLEDDDEFKVQGNKTGIKFRFIGGPGKDHFINDSKAKKIEAYDVSFEKNTITGKGIKNKISPDPQTNTYTRLGFLYSSFSPSPGFEYAGDGGLFLGVKLNSTTQGFRKSPYATHQTISVTRAISSSSYHIKYGGNFIEVARHTNLLISGDLKLPTTKTRFYGIGNNTLNDKTKTDGQKYYIARYSLGNLLFSFRNFPNSWLTLKAGPILQYFNFKGKDNSNKYIETANPPLPQPGALLRPQYYAGVQGGFEVNTINNSLFPTRGILFNVTAQSLKGLNQYSKRLNQVGGNFSFYSDFIAKKHVVLASDFGAGHNLGTYQFFQAQYLGFKENLRGYRIQRFAGRTRVYNNTELRWNMGNVNLHLFKGPFGLLAFNDVARVWADNEKSSTWHNGYGAGIWLAPFNRVVLAANLTYSKEENNLLLINFGFQF